MKFKDIKTTKFNSALLFVFSALLFFSCNDPDGKGSPPPLNSEMIGKWNLVSGVQKDLSTNKETKFIGSDEFRMAFIFLDDGSRYSGASGYFLMNENYEKFSWKTNEDKRYAEIVIPIESSYKTRLDFRRSAVGDVVIEFTTADNIQFKGTFTNNSTFPEEGNDKIIGCWGLRAVKGWVYDDEDEKKYPVDETTDNDDMIFEFYSGGKGRVTVIDLDEPEPEIEDVSWVMYHKVLMIKPKGSSEGMAMYVSELTDKKLVFTTMEDDEQYLDLTLGKK